MLGRLLPRPIKILKAKADQTRLLKTNQSIVRVKRERRRTNEPSARYLRHVETSAKNRRDPNKNLAKCIIKLTYCCEVLQQQLS